MSRRGIHLLIPDQQPGRHCRKYNDCFYVLFCCAIFLLLLTGDDASAQKEDNVWVFGDSLMVDFNSGAPVSSLVSSAYIAAEGCASISDETGQLILYTNGLVVYGKNRLPLPNGSGLNLTSTNSTTQGAVIAPVPGRPELYYIFSLEDISTPGGLRYSVVDMNLNGGIGDVLPGQKAILLDNGLTEKMTVTATCDRIWLMVRSRNANEYKAYGLTESGINTTPVISTIGNASTESYARGELRFSPDGLRMAAAMMSTQVNQPTLELYDFDNTTGLLSNARVLDKLVTNEGYYSTCFSPDNSKIYAKIGQIRQFDLGLPSLAAIVASRTEIGPIVSHGAMRTGPDGKLYIGRISSPYYLHCIKLPNLAGTACEFIPNSLALPSGAISNGYLGLPNAVVALNGLFKDSITSIRDTTTCLALQLTCPPDATSRLWSTGSGEPFITVSSPGTYWVKYISSCIRHTDTFHVSFITPPVIDLGKDTMLCAGAPLSMELKATVPAGFELTWSTGESKPGIHIGEPGHYWVRAVYGNCTSSDSIRIETEICDCPFHIPSAFSPNGDGVNDIFLPVTGSSCPELTGYQLSIYNRWGQRVFQTKERTEGWDGTFNSQPSDLGVYMYNIRYSKFGETFKRKGDMTLLR